MNHVQNYLKESKSQKIMAIHDSFMAENMFYLFVRIHNDASRRRNDIRRQVNAWNFLIVVQPLSTLQWSDAVALYFCGSGRGLRYFIIIIIICSQQDKGICHGFSTAPILHCWILSLAPQNFLNFSSEIFLRSVEVLWFLALPFIARR